MDCPICHRTIYWCNGHGPAPAGSGAPSQTHYSNGEQ